MLFRSAVKAGKVVWSEPKEIGVSLKLKLMGRDSDQPRRVVLKSRAVQGVAEATVVCPEVVFKPGEHDKTVTVLAQRPSQVDTTLQAEIYIDASDPACDRKRSGKEAYSCRYERVYY